MIKQRLKLLRALITEHKLAGYIVPSNDEYMSEYVPAYAKRLEYITGFTGSNGLAIILPDKVLFFTDGRYLTQSKNELDSKEFKIFDQKDLFTFPWSEHLTSDGIIGYDPKLFTMPRLKLFSVQKLQGINTNLIDRIWQDQPAKPKTTGYIYSEEYAGLSYLEKLALCRNELAKHQADYLLITALDSICWLFNIRANDVEFSPLILGLAIISKDGAYLFTDLERINKNVRDSLANVNFMSEDQLEEFLSNIKGRCIASSASTSEYLLTKLKAEKVDKPDPCQILKARKNPTEIHYAKEGHIKDAVAVCEFLAWFYEEGIGLTEYELGKKMTEFRASQEGYISDSFPVICGFNENSAVIHYRANPHTAKKIEDQGLLLIDSGGQYLGATTDITRTISIGNPKSEQIRHYTQVLKGHINLARAKFPYGVTGGNLDILARQFLWQEGEDYAHGTGHGVGSFLSVHEGPQNISLRSNIPLETGMIISNEPGYYKPGDYGIRIENLVYVAESSYSGFSEFRNLTLVPYCKDLIDFSMLTKAELQYLKCYYQNIIDNIADKLSTKSKKWLEKQVDI